MKAMFKSWTTALLTLLCVMILILTNHGPESAGVGFLGLVMFFTFVFSES